jgi:hypothetical protein
MTEKIPMKTSRHSRELIKAIQEVRAKYPDADSYLLMVDDKPKIQIKSGDLELSKPCDLQWDAWMEARDGASRTE